MLNGDVERARRLVGDQQVGAPRQRQGDHHPLPHAPGELMGIGPQHLAGSRQLDQVKQLDGAIGD